MPPGLDALSFDAKEPLRLAQFWAGVLGRELIDHSVLGPALLPSDDTEFLIRFRPSRAQKSGPNQMHFDLPSASLEEQEQTVAGAIALGAHHLDVGQLPEEEHVVLADPEGNEFCVIEPGNTFLAGTGTIGALSSEGSRAVGYFWSAALGWPLVWDNDEETAIQSPRGGTKIAWGGPPINPKTGKNRLCFDLAPPAYGDQQAEVDRLVSLGATRVDDQADRRRVMMADPDGNEFYVLAPRAVAAPRVEG